MSEALELLSGGEVAVVAGCTDWMVGLGQSPPPGNILDITRIAELRGISRLSSSWKIGAATTWTDVIQTDLPPCFDGLKAAAHEVGSVQIQNTATLAGNICNASPAADGVPALLALDCDIEIVSKNARRRVLLAEFITGVRATVLRPQEMVSALFIPDIPGDVGSSFLKLGARKYLVISIAMVSALIGLDNSGRINLARVAVGACSPVARRLQKLEQALVGLGRSELASPELVTSEFLSNLVPITDLRASAEYRTSAVVELCQRAIVAAAPGVA